MATSFETRLGTAPEEGIKPPCVVASVTNLTLSGEQTVNSVAVVAGDRVLVKSQTDTTENGIYDVAASAWTRTTDFNAANDVVSGVLVLDTTNLDLYQASFSGSWTPGTTAITFSNFSASAAENVTYTPAGVGVTTTDTETFLRLFGVRPEDFGAVRDGTTDDATALQTAATFAEDNKLPLNLFNGRYAFSTTLAFEDRITIRGQNKEDTKLVWTGGASIAVHLRAVFAGGDDSEECWLGHFSILNEGTGTIGLQIDPSYTTLDHVRVYHDGSSAAFSTAMVQTDTTVNVNQLKCYNLEIRGDNATGGPLGFHYARGSNSVFHGGTFSSFQTCLKVGDFTDNGNSCSNLEISGGILFETQGPFQTAGSIGLHIDGVEGLKTSGRFEFGGGTPSDATALGIYITGRMRGWVHTCSDTTGSGVALSAIDFGPTTESARGVHIFGNNFLSLGGASDNVIKLSGTSNTITGATQANPVVVTANGHTLLDGDEATIESITGMTEINNRKFIVANKTTNTFELTGENGTGHTAYSSGGTAIKYADPDITIGNNSMTSIGGNNPIIDGTLRDQDATPSVGPGNVFITANTVATTITDFDGVDRETYKEVIVRVNDSFTTFDFSSSALKGNRGRDYTATSGDYINAKHEDGLWYCDVTSFESDTATTAALADNSNVVNVSNKYTGKTIFNTTTGLPVWADGGTAGSTWSDATGAVAHTPV